MRRGVPCRSTEDLGPVGSQSLDVLGIDAMRERVAQLRVGKAPLVVGGGKREKCRSPSGKLINCRSVYWCHRHTFVMGLRSPSPVQLPHVVRCVGV
jgi:hypothetical protein